MPEGEGADLVEESSWDRSSAERALLIYDGDCGFCRACAGYAQMLVGSERLAVGTGAAMADSFDELSDADCAASVWLAEPSGRVFGGAEAVFRCLAMAAGWGWLLLLYRFLPGFSALSEAGYGLVARQRARASAVTAVLWGRPLLPSTFGVGSALFLRALGLVYFAAFASMAVQLSGLVGAAGVLPIAELLEAAQHQLGAAAYHRLPTHAWLWSSDASLVGAAWLGAGCSHSLVVILAQPATLAVEHLPLLQKI